MGALNFLNVELILLYLSDWLDKYAAPIWGPAPVAGNPSADAAAQASASLVSETTWFWLGQFALIGMSLAFILLVASVYLRIKLELYEHEEFHKRDAKYAKHGHDEHGAHGGHGSEAHAAPAGNARWQEILKLSSSQSESDWRRAIMEADIMLGDALDSVGYRGNTIGDKLKDANPLQMTTLDLAWKAHKVRNDIAHGGEGFHLSEWDTKAAIDFYRRVFEEFKFIN